MYQYAATEKSGNIVKRSEYTNVYTRRDGEFMPIDEAAGSRLGVIGFKKYLNTYSELGDVMNDLILEKYDSIWSHAFYMPGVSSFDPDRRRLIHLYIPGIQQGHRRGQVGNVHHNEHHKGLVHGTSGCRQR